MKRALLIGFSFSSFAVGCAVRPLNGGDAPAKPGLERAGESHGFKATVGRLFTPSGDLQIQLELVNASERSWEVSSAAEMRDCAAAPSVNGWKVCVADEAGRALALSCRAQPAGLPERTWIAVNDTFDALVGLSPDCYGVSPGSQATVRASFDSELRAERGGPVVGRLHVETPSAMRVQFTETQKPAPSLP